MIRFAAVLLAGGRSRRMGRDKALLPLPDGHLLWERQYAVLQALEPDRIFISGPRRPEFPVEVDCLEDKTPEQGPLGGIATALDAMDQQTHLIVLAVDLPNMSADYLRWLSGLVEPGLGCVPQHPPAADGFYEPLAAVYPKECLPLARNCLQTGSRAMQAFVKQAGALIRPVSILPTERTLFENWNSPSDQNVAAPA